MQETMPDAVEYGPQNGEPTMKKAKSLTRRQWLCTAAGVGAAATAAPGLARTAPAQTTKLRLTMACWDYDRTHALADSRVAFDGIELTYLPLLVEETFFRMMRYHEFDVSEMSLSSYTLSLFTEKPPFIAIPVFPSRMFRHNGLFINVNSGIREPKDLIGKKIGTPEERRSSRSCTSSRYGARSMRSTHGSRNL